MNLPSKTLVPVLVAVLACAATGPSTAQQYYPQRPADRPCNPKAALVGGLLIGALLGGKHHRGTGAAIGGTVGTVACVSANYQARQVRTADQVSQDYSSQNGGNLPAQAALVQYRTRISPGDRIHPGQPSTVDSDIEVVQGTDGVRPAIEEEITLYGPDGKALKAVRKPANEGASAGEFQTQFAFTLPQGVPEGSYQFKTVLYLNGQPVRDSQLPLQVVSSSM